MFAPFKNSPTSTELDNNTSQKTRRAPRQRFGDGFHSRLMSTLSCAFDSRTAPSAKLVAAAERPSAVSMANSPDGQFFVLFFSAEMEGLEFGLPVQQLCTQPQKVMAGGFRGAPSGLNSARPN